VARAHALFHSHDERHAFGERQRIDEDDTRVAG
jgi:hypothetical protein